MLAELGAGRALVVLLAVGLGIAFLGERPGAGVVGGIVHVLAGSDLSTGGAARK
jgi:drug/metabolite transporter (DMT)-like permease